MDIKKWIAVVAVLALAACSEDEGQQVPLGEDAEQSETRRASWPAELTAQVDSANAAIAGGEYETAAEIYRSLVEQYPDIGTVWFGLYMAEDALGNTDAAEAALEKAEAITPGLGRMHDAAESDSMPAGMPEGHPPTMPSGHPPLDSASPEDAPPLTGGGG